MAGSANTEKRIEELIQPTVTEMGYELVDVEFVKEGPNWYLRIFIDKEGGVTIDDCEAVSKTLEKIFDEKDPIEQAYFLEISSPGIDRPLKKKEDFIKYNGEMVDVKLYKPYEGSKEYTGKLVGYDENDGTVTIEVDDKNIAFTKKEIAGIRLAVIF
ncbi:ribosome maturation factor RimP [Anaerotignum sp. MSJ-24]|uniref:ribosome maturation factor RimP n=1 Tax=Anaerotignum sp. MSJ-24 TaxID=2841521 RepID=UPI001C10F715|nr:ribosome maturation factor RimP [Anaerotignum sp. MSJ-24]MBU5463803.1 ribosome maturation factor RimP [Anaerotignum sp. MSJ-24]